MIKYSLLAGAMLIASPAFAQQVPTSTPVAPQTAPVPTTTPAQTAPMTDQAAPAPTTTPQAADPMASTEPTTAASPAAQVAQLVEAQFPSYDKGGNGALSKTEFAAWMASLRANDPAAKPGSSALKKWVDQAFAQTDTDKSKTVSKTELETFLAKGQG